METITFNLQDEYIHLIQLLKATNVVSSGGEAKMVVEDELVQYNGQVDTRKRLKVRKGDVIIYDQYEIKVL